MFRQPLITCPNCKGDIQKPDEIDRGKRFRCSLCNRYFIYMGDGEALPPEAARLEESRRPTLGIGDGFRFACGFALFLFLLFVIVPLIFLGGACGFLFRNS